MSSIYLLCYYDFRRTYKIRLQESRYRKDFCRYIRIFNLFAVYAPISEHII